MLEAIKEFNKRKATKEKEYERKDKEYEKNEKELEEQLLKQIHMSEEVLLIK